MIRKMVVLSSENDEPRSRCSPTVKDLTELSVLTEESALKHLSERYEEECVYTWAGPTLVSLNPCKQVPRLYKKEFMEVICTSDPHVWSMAKLAFTHVGMETKDQAIVISGESGAGKTSSTRYILEWVAHICRSKNGTFSVKKLADVLESSNPVLEAFGNAHTLHNHNSSRFGKFIQLMYETAGCSGEVLLNHARISTYLLEKTRVASQPPRERNFHIFYQMMAGLAMEELERFGLEPQQVHRILPCTIRPSDATAFHNTCSALHKMGMTPETLCCLLKILAGILHLGDIHFKKDGVSVSIDKGASLHSLNWACHLLGFGKKNLVLRLTSATIVAGASGTHRRASILCHPFEDMDQAMSRRDCLLRVIYQAVFHWIVAFINSMLSSSDIQNIYKTFGILDIYGFEWLERNSLEQLCINYANERLQHLFATGFLEETRKILSQEGIGQLTDESFTTEKSLSCLDILHGPKSVMGILNEECQLKRDLHASEERLPERLKISLCPHACVHVSCVTKKKGTFIIKHYAGNVEYSLEGMLEKNKDEVPDELLSLLMESQNPLLQEMAKMHGNRLSSDTSPRRTQRKITILAKFKMSLDNLLGILSSSHVHYIRCIRPNNEGLPNHFSNEDVHRQLAACGIYETIQISQAGFRVRVGYGEFLDRFGVLARGSFRSNFREVHVGNTMSPAEVVQKILKRSLGTERVNQECRFGHTRLFGTENVFEDLETTLRTHQDVAVRSIQHAWRIHSSCRYKAAVIIQKWIRGWRCRQHYRRITGAVICIQRWWKQLSPKETTTEPSNSEKKLQISLAISEMKHCDILRGIISVYCIQEVRKIHVKRSCLPHAYNYPRVEKRSQGLLDLLRPSSCQPPVF